MIKGLKPCPFCGCTNQRWESEVSGHGECDQVILCDCGAGMKPRDYNEDVVKKWNRRAVGGGG